jgi:hypothetical protein
MTGRCPRASRGGRRAGRWDLGTGLRQNSFTFTIDNTAKRVARQCVEDRRSVPASCSSVSRPRRSICTGRCGAPWNRDVRVALGASSVRIGTRLRRGLRLLPRRRRDGCSMPRGIPRTAWSLSARRCSRASGPSDSGAHRVRNNGAAYADNRNGPGRPSAASGRRRPGGALQRRSARRRQARWPRDSSR